MTRPIHPRRLGIIGGGPRSLTLIQAAVHAMHRNFMPPIELHIIDPGEPGSGAHPAAQPAYLMTNTLASQITIYSPCDPARPELGHTGPSFTEWARQTGYRRIDHTFCRCTSGMEITDDDYLPRALLGEYLSNAYHHITADLPIGLTVIHHRATAVDIIGDTGRIILTNGVELAVDGVVLATGHTPASLSAIESTMQDFASSHVKKNRHLRYVHDPYPISKLDQIESQAVVGIQGMGLTALDCIAALTLGRGGRYEAEADGLRYCPSGHEPRIRLFSRSAIPIAIRGINQKGVAGSYQPIHLTREAINTLILQKGARGSVDFESDVMPLLMLEMAVAASIARGEDVNAGAATAEALAGITELIKPTVLEGHKDIHTFRTAIRDFIARDIKEASKGNCASWVKAAADVIRDCRPIIGWAIETKLMSARSYQYIAEIFNPLANRIAYGPPLRRGHELFALLRSGHIALAGGPQAKLEADRKTGKFLVKTTFGVSDHTERFDVLIRAQVPIQSPARDASPLMRQLVSRGDVEPFKIDGYHPSGVSITENYRVTSAHKQPLPIWALGCLIEGLKFYTHALPRPGRYSDQHAEATQIIQDFLATQANATAAA